jgi:hypothetical protein
VQMVTQATVGDTGLAHFPGNLLSSLQARL